MKITGTFLDEISHDIPHQNWGREEWRRDFRNMCDIGIDTVILIRCGYRRWLTYPSQVLIDREQCYKPPVDLVKMFLELAEEFNMQFFFGTYDSGQYWHCGKPEKELDLNLRVIEEVWKQYGHYPAFKGWYLSLEISRRYGNIVDLYPKFGHFCKDISGNLPVMISPYLAGIKAVNAFSTEMSGTESLSVSEHEREWNEIMSSIQGAVDITAFQDGHCDYHELENYLHVNCILAEKYGMECWSNCESFDRDIPIKFLPIKWEKMLLKLQAAKRAGISKSITFEFSHFMSPNSSYSQAGNLYNRYKEHFNI